MPQPSASAAAQVAAPNRRSRRSPRVLTLLPFPPFKQTLLLCNRLWKFVSLTQLRILILLIIMSFSLFSAHDLSSSLLLEHARYSPRCPLFQLLVGRMFVLGVLNERELTPDTRPATESYVLTCAVC